MARPRTAEFDKAIRSAHRVVVRCDVLSGGAVIAKGVPVAGGSVTADAGQFARRTCSVRIASPEMSPAVSKLLRPYGNEIRLWRGLVLPSGVEELVAIGTFGIWDVDETLPFSGIQVSGIDRSKLVAETRFPWPRTAVASSALDLLRALLLEAAPLAGFGVDPRIVDAAAPQVTWDEDRQKAVLDVATALGAEVFADPMGTFTVRPVPDPGQPAVWRVDAGAQGVLVGARRKLTRDGVFNGVRVAGQSVGQDPAPSSALQVDSNPLSPTFWDGGFGRITLVVKNSLVTSQAQANTAAAAILRSGLGLARSVSLSAAVQPAIEPGDVIEVAYDAATVERHLIDRLVIPLEATGTMGIDTRTSSYQLAG